MAGKFEVYEDTAGKWRFRLRDERGEIVASGQGYVSAQSARAGCAKVQSTCDSGPAIVEVDG